MALDTNDTDAAYLVDSRVHGRGMRVNVNVREKVDVDVDVDGHGCGGRRCGGLCLVGGGLLLELERGRTRELAPMPTIGIEIGTEPVISGMTALGNDGGADVAGSAAAAVGGAAAGSVEGGGIGCSADDDDSPGANEGAGANGDRQKTTDETTTTSNVPPHLYSPNSIVGVLTSRYMSRVRVSVSGSPLPLPLSP